MGQNDPYGTSSVKSINAANYSYTFTATPYCEKLIGEPTTYYASANEKVVRYFISKLQSHVNFQDKTYSLTASIPACLLLNGCCHRI